VIACVRCALNVEAGRQAVGHVILFQLGVANIDWGDTFVLHDERVLSARYEKEAGQEEVLAGCSANVAFDLMMPTRLTSYRLRRRLRGQSIHVDASVVVGDVDLAAIDDGRVEFVETN